MKSDRARKPSKGDVIAMSVASDYAHANSTVIHSRIRVLHFEAEETDKSIIAMLATLAQMKERRARLAATIAGLHAVIARR